MKVNRCLERVARLVMAMVLGVGLTTSAGAQTILVDFGSDNSFRGVSVPVPDVNGNYWNSLTPGPFFPNLIDIDNIVTTIAIGFDTPVGTDSFNGPAGATSFPDPTPAEIAATDIDAAALGNLGVKEAAIDFAASPGGANNNTRFQIQGLNPSKTYTLTLFGSHKFSDNDTTVYSVFTDNTYTTLVDSASLNVQTPGMPWLHNRDTVATISNLAPQASNILYVQFVGSQGNLGYLNSFQLTAVPEPAALFLMAGCLGMVAVVRRRS
ncbi:MAG: PEP-CTERM sorting domain-containing protein [Pirellulales bacterium]|nr:PEP-CTERM sorting domain-containing protein [Pirellulales bacterium]